MKDKAPGGGMLLRILSIGPEITIDVALSGGFLRFFLDKDGQFAINGCS
jgi:hypothetical protein